MPVKKKSVIKERKLPPINSDYKLLSMILPDDIKRLLALERLIKNPIRKEFSKRTYIGMGIMIGALVSILAHNRQYILNLFI